MLRMNSNIVAFAKQKGFPLASFGLKDGSKMHIMSDIGTATVHFCSEKDGAFLGAFSIRDNTYKKQVKYLTGLKDMAINPKDADDAWIKCHTVVIA